MSIFVSAWSNLHKIWLIQEADARGWSSLKHVQPKEGRKELAPREIKFRYRGLGVAVSLVYIGEIEDGDHARHTRHR